MGMDFFIKDLKVKSIIQKLSNVLILSTGTTDRNDEIENDYFTEPEEIEEVFPTNLARNYLNGDSFKHSNYKMKSQKTVSRKHKLNRYITLRPFNSPWLQYAICFRNFHGNKVELLLKLCMAQRNVIASKIGYPG